MFPSAVPGILSALDFKMCYFFCLEGPGKALCHPVRLNFHTPLCKQGLSNPYPALHAPHALESLLTSTFPARGHSCLPAHHH